MKRFTWKQLTLCGALMATSLCTQAAVEAPAVPTQTLTSGEQYVLFNLARPDGYFSRTSWDGALYFLGATDSNYANHQFKAEQNEDGTWSFVIETPAAEEGVEPTRSYMALLGSANVNFGTDPAVWSVTEGTQAGYYQLIAGEGNNENSIGHLMHLNNGQQYFVVSFPGDAWYPDFAVKVDENGNQVYDEATGFFHMADSTSTNWAFVKADDVPAYAMRYEGYNAINRFTNEYVIIGGDYATGFQLTADAMEAVYGEQDYDATNTDSINNMANAKVALFNEIEKAIALNVDGNASLTTAITTAKAAFDTLVIPAELKEALNALLKAESDYSQGLGDYTSLGQNMSFEDLSAQGGNTTTGVANAPAGWNLYVNGVLCQTAEELRAAGLTAWCGVNADCTGETKDGSNGFGIWNQGMPAIELSQTIKDLENGTYEISAAMMVGANGSGSRRTTQRLFGNLNSTYFASEGEYNLSLLDKGEVYSFASLIEPTTDTEMQPITVRAYVYDGTLTFGFRTDANVAAANRTSSNSAGGDGWFKIDNFRIAKVGYDANDALNVLKHYVNILDSYFMESEAIYKGALEMLEAGMDEFQSIDNNTPQEEINKGITNAIALLAEVQPYMDAYAKLGEALIAAYEGLAKYDYMPGASAFAEVIGQVEMNYADGVYDIAGVDEAIAELEAALEACMKSEITVGKDVTYLLKNPSFEDMSTQAGGDSPGVADAPKGWTLILDGDTCRTAAEISAHNIANWCAINSGDAIEVESSTGEYIYKQPTDGEKLWGIWTEFIPEVELSQRITGLPMGTYTLTADVMVENNWAGDNITTQRIFANSFVQMFSYDGNHVLNMPQDAINASELDAKFTDYTYPQLTYAGYTCGSGDATTKLLKPMKLVFFVGESGVANIGFRTNGINVDGLSRADEGGRSGQGWFKVDNFRLSYDSTTVPAGIRENLTSDQDAKVVSRQYFNANGVELAAPAQGVNIVKELLENGQVIVSKKLVK